MLLATHENTDIGQLFRVNDAEDISFLISESEIMTGSPGRKFVISSADRLVYRIHWHVDGYTMQRLDGNDEKKAQTHNHGSQENHIKILKFRNLDR